MKVWRGVRILAALGLVAATLILNLNAIMPNLTTAALSLLLAILGISAVWGLVEATIASIAATLGINYYYLTPIHSFWVSDPEDWVVFVTFIITALVSNHLAARARHRAQEAEGLNKVGRWLLASHDLRARTLAEAVRESAGCTWVRVRITEPGETYTAGSPDESDEKKTGESMAIALNSESVEYGRMEFGGVKLSAVGRETLRTMLAMAFERKSHQEQILEAEAERRSEVLKSALVDSVAHEYRTPLTAIKAAVTEMLDSPRVGQDLEFLIVIDEETDHINRLLEESLTLVRMDSSAVQLDRRAEDIESIIRTCLSELEPLCRDCIVETKLPADLPRVWADAAATRQVVRQLVTNAVRYAGRDGPIGVEVSGTEREVRVCVRDQGVGIRPDDLPHVFERYYRGKKTSLAGMGLGLSIAKQLVEAGGGRIWVESRRGEGAVFGFTLPTVRPEETK